MINVTGSSFSCMVAWDFLRGVTVTAPLRVHEEQGSVSLSLLQLWGADKLGASHEVLSFTQAFTEQQQLLVY